MGCALTRPEDEARLASAFARLASPPSDSGCDGGGSARAADLAAALRQDLHSIATGDDDEVGPALLAWLDGLVAGDADARVNRVTLWSAFVAVSSRAPATTTILLDGKGPTPHHQLTNSTSSISPMTGELVRALSWAREDPSAVTMRLRARLGCYRGND